MRVVHAVAGSHVDLQLRHAIGEVAVLARISSYQTVDTNQNACPTSSIPQRVKPFAIRFGFLDTHELIVAQGLHMRGPSHM